VGQCNLVNVSSKREGVGVSLMWNAMFFGHKEYKEPRSARRFFCNAQGANATNFKDLKGRNNLGVHVCTESFGMSAPIK
jgi:hypothetical protein